MIDESLCSRLIEWPAGGASGATRRPAITRETLAPMKRGFRFNELEAVHSVCLRVNGPFDESRQQNKRGSCCDCPAGGSISQ